MARRHHFLAIQYRPVPAIPSAQNLAVLARFQLFDLPTNTTYLSPFLSPNLYRPSLVASYAPSDPPEPLSTSVLCGCCRLYRYRRFLTSGEESLANPEAPQRRNIATPHLLPTTTNATDVITDGMQGRNVIWHAIAHRR